MILLLAEKPDMAKKIGEALGIKERKKGYFILNNGNYLTWAIGHIVNLKQPNAYPQYQKWSLDQLPIIPPKMELEISSGKKEQFDVIQSLLKQCSCLYIASDPDREGELIARYIMEYAGYNGQYKRLWINDLTKETITKAYAEVKDGKLYDNLAAAARLRSYADYWIGMSATRYFTLLANSKGNNSTLNAGRVLTPTLKLVYEREMEMTNHKVSYKHHFIAAYKNGLKAKYIHTVDEKQTHDLTKTEIEQLQAATKDIKSALVKDVQTKVQKISPPPFFNTDTIKAAARKAYKYGIKKTEQLVQSLYDKGFISYPRTSSNHITHNVAQELVNYITAFKSTYPQYFQSQLRDLIQDKRYVDDEKASVHYAIIPTKQLAKDLTEDEKHIYDLIVKQTLLAFQALAEDEETTVIMNHHEHLFTAKSKVKKTLGFRALFNEEKNKEHDEAEALTTFDLKTLQKGQLIQVEKYESKIIASKPPKRFAEDELVAAMGNIGSKLKIENLKEKGIGTPATRAATVEKLKTEEFIKVEKNLIYITQKGLAFMEMVKDHQLANVELTSDFENLLTEVEEGRLSFTEAAKKFKDFTHELVQTTFSVSQDFSNQEVIADCICGKGKIVSYKEHYGCTQYKEGCKVSISKVFRKKPISSKIAAALIKGDNVVIHDFVNGEGKSYSLVLFMKEGTLQTRFPNDHDLKIADCFICKSPVLEKEKLYVCKTENCLKIFKTFLGKDITKTIAKTLATGKTTSEIEGMVVKGKAVKGKLKYSKEEKRVVFDNHKK